MAESSSSGEAHSSRSTKRGYDRLNAAEEDANGNSSPAPLRASHASATPATTPSEAGGALTPTTPSTDMDVGSSGSPSLLESSDCDHYMTHSDSSDSSSDDDDEALTCNVCDRAFPTSRLLASHQTRKRHYGCSTCENVFPTLMSLEAHKE
ncbi:uncharacterized protein LOC135104014 [Scylla paramamosain]|uniref:uncharacterized protein LOC135104014 n=1 Tax=Scylla paramamosain TaxID=85552 RepID=UPI0030832DE4